MTTSSRLLACFTLLGVLSALTACDTIGAALGMQRSVPDTKQVTMNPPLTIPPDYALKPPRETPKDQEVDVPNQPKADQASEYTPSPANPNAPAPMPR